MSHPTDILTLAERRALRCALHGRSVFEELPVTWYEYPRHSNFDKANRERLRQFAEDEGLVVYSRGGPRATEAGIEWANTTTQL